MSKDLQVIQAYPLFFTLFINSPSEITVSSLKLTSAYILIKQVYFKNFPQNYCGVIVNQSNSFFLTELSRAMDAT